MWRWALIACLAALVGAACVEVRLVPAGDGSSSGGAGGATTSSTSTTGGGGTGGSPKTCGCDQLDVLMVIDNSSSLQDNIIDLVNVFFVLDEYVAEIAERACSFHFGVVTGTAKDDQPDPECNVLGGLSYTDASGQVCLEGKRFLTSDDPVLDLASCFVTTGSTGDGNERIMEAMVKATTDPTLIGPGGCNEGFGRPDAPLILLFIADLDDNRSDIDNNLLPDDPQAWYDAVVASRGGDASKVVAVGLVPPGGGGALCEGALAPRIEAFFDAFPDGQKNTANICDTDTVEVRDKVLALADRVCPVPQ